MDRDFLDKYNNELTFLHDMGRQFATANPKTASLLELSGDGSEDPHVERLIQAFAFIAARIRKKLDDEYPEVSNALLSVIFPHFLRPIPSMTIVQFQAGNDPSKAVSGQTISRGTVLKSPFAVEGVRCQFHTSYPVTLWPIAVESASLIPEGVVQEGKPSGAVSLLKLGLNCHAQGGWAALQKLRSLRFFLGGKEPAPSVLYECLFSRVREVWIQGQAPGGKPFRRTLRRRPISRVGFEAGEELYASHADGAPQAGKAGRVGLDPEEQLYPFPERSFPGYRLIQDFFAFPEKYLFFDLQLADSPDDESNPLSRAGLEGTVEIWFWLDQPPRHEIVVRPENFRLGCTPAVNLFRWSPEPITWNRLKTQYQVVPDAQHPEGYEVFSVDRVVSSGSFLDEGFEFQPFYAMRHFPCEPAKASRRPGQTPEPAVADRTAYWFASRQPSIRGDDGTEVFLSFTDSRFNPTSPAVETVTTHLTCSNRELPPKLKASGEHGMLEPEADKAVGQALMLFNPTPPRRPPLGRSIQWRMISHLSLNHLSLMGTSNGADVLRELLTLYDFSRTAATRRMIEGVLSVSHSRIAGRVAFPSAGDGAPAAERARVQRLKGKPLSLGIQINLHLDENAFPGGMAYLLASVLDRFFGAYVTINSFVQLVATSKQREVNWVWPPRSGDRTLL